MAERLSSTGGESLPVGCVRAGRGMGSESVAAGAECVILSDAFGEDFATCEQLAKTLRL